MASRRPYAEEDDADEDNDAEDGGRGREAWERAYADDRSWEALQEDESGLLRPFDKAEQQRQHRRRIQAAVGTRIQRGIIRYLYLVIDMSRAAAEMDFRPNNIAVVANAVESFIREFFDQNPLSHLGLIIIRNGLAQRLTELSGSPEAHIKALRNNMECGGDSSLQNALDLARGVLTQIPSYGYREVLIVYSALSTCDPGDIMDTLAHCKMAKIRCSLVGLSAEIYICKLLCERTGGIYSVALNENHLKELILEHAPPPPALAESAIASLVRMGFPERSSEEAVALCACHKEVKIGSCYTCPQCRARVCELPTECNICELTLVSSPHLARSYHHLFPVASFEEVVPTVAPSRLPKSCFGCQQDLPVGGSKVTGVRVVCPSNEETSDSEGQLVGMVLDFYRAAAPLMWLHSRAHAERCWQKLWPVLIWVEAVSSEDEVPVQGYTFVYCLHLF
ncbi:hypothetical protein GOP47_0012336 [Adiantum capillus-veneris]|uniref:General transcription factor IIH subunit n=1 Tax=Adiantum capillus-veneris TaxID=13818 RepID=A0A9D4UQT6_ADICA|nr:hypothetical protein GOP47_0012336 [Adiantum capillus-veneris]